MPEECILSHTKGTLDSRLALSYRKTWRLISSCRNWRETDFQKIMSAPHGTGNNLTTSWLGGKKRNIKMSSEQKGTHDTVNSWNSSMVINCRWELFWPLEVFALLLLPNFYCLAFMSITNIFRAQFLVLSFVLCSALGVPFVIWPVSAIVYFFCGK